MFTRWGQAECLSPFKVGTQKFSDTLVSLCQRSKYWTGNKCHNQAGLFYILHVSLGSVTWQTLQCLFKLSSLDSDC